MTKLDELVKLDDDTRATERKCREVLADHVKILERHIAETQAALATALTDSIELRLELREERRRRRVLDPACRDLDGFMDNDGSGDEA